MLNDERGIESPSLRVVRCFVGEESYALAVSDVLGVYHADQLSTSPGGDLLLERPKGRIPVMRLFALLGRGGTRQAGQAGQVAELAGAPCALLVDRIGNVSDVAAGDRFPLPAVARGSRPLFGEVLRTTEGLLLRIDVGLGAERPDAERTMAKAVPARRAAVEAVRPAAPSAPSSRRCVLFDLSEGTLAALALPQVREVVDAGRVVPVPGAPPFVRGLLAWREGPVPVVDLARRLGLRPLAGRRPRHVVVRSRHELVAFPAEGSLEVRPADPARSARGAPPAFTRGSFERDGVRIVVPDVDALLEGG